MKVRILFKNNRYYIQTYRMEMTGCPYDAGRYVWEFVTEGFLGMTKKSFPTLNEAEEYANTISDGVESYKIIKEINGKFTIS